MSAISRLTIHRKRKPAVVDGKIVFPLKKCAAREGPAAADLVLSRAEAELLHADLSLLLDGGRTSAELDRRVALYGYQDMPIA